MKQGNPAKESENKEAIQLRVEQWPFVTMPSKLVIDSRVSDSAKVTYAALCLWGGMDGKAFPSRDKLAQARGVKRSTIYRHLQELESSGWISRQAKVLRTGAKVSVITVKRGPDNETRGAGAAPPSAGAAPLGSQNQDQGVPLSGLGGPDNGTHKEKRKEKKKDNTYTHPFEFSSSEKEASAFAQKISRHYPHGWGQGGTRHSAGIKQVSSILISIPKSEWESILQAAKDYKLQMNGNPDQQYCPALWRWIEQERWRELGEIAQNGREIRGSTAEDASRIRRQVQIDQAAAIGLTLDPETLEVIDWGPQGPPDKKHNF